MTVSLTKADGTYSPVGTVANYSLSHSAVPVDPRETSGQIPTFNVIVSDVDGDPKALAGTEVMLEDWTGSVNSGRVTAASSSNNGKAAIDASTIFERLNTEQTVLPIIYNEVASVDPVREALAHWMLMCGITPERLDGKLLQYLGGDYVGISTFGYIADSISKFRFYGPADEYVTFVPSATTYTNPIEVNPAQGVTIGGGFALDNTLSEIVLTTTTLRNNTTVLYKVRRNGSTWTVREKVGSAAETVLLTKTYAPTSSNNTIYAFAKVSANAAADKVDITLRLMELGTGDVTVISDTTATAVTSTLRNRPRLSSVKLGYDIALTGGHTVYGRPTSYFLLESAPLQAVFPVDNYAITTAVSVLDAEFKDKMPFKIPGFTGNVWDKMRELCSILELDIYFERDIIRIVYRDAKRETIGGDFIPALNVAKGSMVEKVADRETARSVDVLYREMLGSDADFANTLLWKSTSVYTLERGETVEEVIQTDSSFVLLHQPLPVSGVPVPYNSAFGSYVITGNDGYIVDPTWWKDNGGSIKVEQTGVSGEIKLIMQAPTVDTVRAPYRVSEGVADRPALYILGYGMRMSEPKTLKTYTGADDAAQDVGVTFDSPFITKKLLAQNTGHKLAVTYGTATSDASFVISQADQLPIVTSVDPLTPLGDCVYWKGSYYRIASESIAHGSITVNTADRFNTIGVVNGEFATGKTVADWNALHAGKVIREVNIAPLPKYEG